MDKKLMFVRLLLCFLVASLVIGLVAGCASEDSVGDEDAETIVDDDVAINPGDEKTNIEIYTFFAGTSVYSVGVAMQELINSQSDILQATAIEGRDAAANVKILLDDEAARQNTIIWGNPAELWSLRVGNSPYDQANNDIRPFVSNALVGEILVTMNPEIKTLSDLSGKRVAVPPGDSSEVVFFEKLLEAAGAEDVRIERLVFSELMTALADGRVDASIAYIYLFSLDPVEFTHGTESQEVMAVHTVYPVYKDAEDIAEAKIMMGNDFPVLELTLQPYELMDTQDEEYAVIAYASCFAAHVDIDPIIVTEFMRIYYENVDRFVDYHPAAKFINTSTAGLLTIRPEYIHPAGLEFVENNGYEYFEDMDWLR